MNTRHGGVGLFYKNSLLVITRNDLSSDETIVVQLKFGRNFFLLFYIELLLLTIPLLKISCQTLKIYIQKSKLGLSQLTSEPTNFEPHNNPSCIDLVVTDQPNIILELI